MIPIKTLQPQDFTIFLPLLLSSFRSEIELQSTNSGYCKKLNEPGGILKIHKRISFKPGAEEIEQVMKLTAFFVTRTRRTREEEERRRTR